MHIALISEHASPLRDRNDSATSGQSVYIAEFAGALTELGHRIDVYTRRDNSTDPDEIVCEAGYRVVNVPAGPSKSLPKSEVLQYTSAFGSALRDRWSNEKPDLAHSHYWLSGVAGGLAARELSIPTVMTFHSLGTVQYRHRNAESREPNADDGLVRRMSFERQIARAADAIIATSTDEVNELNRMGVPRSKASVVPCGVDARAYSPDGPTAPRTSDMKRIVCAGDLTPNHGMDTVIRLLPRIPNAELIIAGGPDRAALQSDHEVRRLHALAVELGVAGRVRLTGRLPRPDLAALLRSADVLVSTPRQESFGISALHAMSCGVPVVATAVGGLSDTVVDGITGLFVDTRKLSAVAHTIERLVCDPPRRFALGVAGADRAQSRYSWDRVAEDSARVYATVAGVASTVGLINR